MPLEIKGKLVSVLKHDSTKVYEEMEASWLIISFMTEKRNNNLWVAIMLSCMTPQEAEFLTGVTSLIR
jgi:hypothetical protein